MHWYNLDGELQDGSNLRDARKQNLLPSVTTILGEMYNYSLEDWKIKQAIKKTLQTPFYDAYTEDEYIKKIMCEYLEKADNAADFGSTIHNLIHRYCTGETPDLLQYDDNVVNAYDNTISWLQRNVKHVIASERTWTSKQFGYAGTIDLIAKMYDGTIAIIDFKTQGSRNGKLHSYPSFVYQLAGYKIMYEENANCEIDACINIVICSNDSIIKVFEHDNDKIYLGKIVFLSLLNVFRYSRNFIWEEQYENISQKR